MDGDKVILVLNRQPPLPKIAPVQIVNQEKIYNDERALVPLSPYVEEQAYIPKEGSSNLGGGPLVTFQNG